jgi:hypothetical protein
MYTPSATHPAALRGAAAGADSHVASDEPTAAELIEDADVVLGNRYFVQSLPHARRLRRMQSNSMGVDLIIEVPRLREAIRQARLRIPAEVARDRLDLGDAIQAWPGGLVAVEEVAWR